MWWSSEWPASSHLTSFGSRLLSARRLLLRRRRLRRAAASRLRGLRLHLVGHIFGLFAHELPKRVNNSPHDVLPGVRRKHLLASLLAGSHELLRGGHGSLLFVVLRTHYPGEVTGQTSTATSPRTSSGFESLSGRWDGADDLVNTRSRSRPNQAVLDGTPVTLRRPVICEGAGQRVSRAFLDAEEVRGSIL